MFGVSLLSACAASDASNAIVSGTQNGDGGTPTSQDGGRGQVVEPSTSTRDDAAAPPEVCERVDTAARPVIPRVLIVADRSASMREGRKWAGSVQAIESVTQELEGSLHFGLTMFPQVGTGLTNGRHKCDADAVSVPVGPMTTAPIASALAAAGQPEGDTPTATALKTAKKVLVDDPANMPDFEYGPAYVMLVNDGEPSENCPGGEQGTFDAIDDLLDADVPTFVVGYNISERYAAHDTMVEMAQRGGTERYYPAEGGDELLGALREIAKSVVSCDYALDEVPPRSDEYIRVTIDDQDVPVGDNGWTRVGDQTVRLNGAACDTLRDGEVHGIEIVVECEPVIVE